MPYLPVYEIKAGETQTLSIDFEGKLPTGVGFAASGHSVSSIGFYSRTTDNTILGGLTPTVSGTVISVVVLNVLLHERYELTFTLTADDGTPSIIVEKVLVIGVAQLSN
jgi:hypothetical protein